MLCDIFGITTGTGSRIFITWILFLEKELGFLLPFSTKEELREISKPNCFKKNCFKNLRAIIDCTEFYVEKPGKPSSQRSTYSQYKSSNTFKLLISMSPILHFNFVSKLYSGSISDKEIVNVSGFLEKLNPGDAVMADKGFNIQDLLALHDTVLIDPLIWFFKNMIWLISFSGSLSKHKRSVCVLFNLLFYYSLYSTYQIGWFEETP